MNQPKRQSKLGQLWVPIQSLALASAIVSPVLFKLDSDGSLDKSLSLHPLRKKASFIDETIEKPTTISSSTLLLPEPNSAGSGGQIRSEIRNRQVRFECMHKGVRAPASRTHAAKWQLDRIERKTDQGEWSPIELVPTVNGDFSGSTFVELDDGMNEFRVTFTNGSGSYRSYPVILRRTQKL